MTRRLIGLACVLASFASTATAQDTTPPKPEPSPAAAAESLQAPKSDDYGPKVDWGRLPPWNKTEFFGIRARGKVFIYVVDCSGSMGDDARLLRAKAEIRKSVMDLRWPQKFHVIFFNDRVRPLPGDTTRSADWTSKRLLLQWFNTIGPDGPTDPREAVSQAVKHQPDAVFLLSDGDFPDGSVEAIAKANSRKVPIHAVDLSGGAGGDHLKRIAKESGGEYVSKR